MKKPRVINHSIKRGETNIHELKFCALFLNLLLPFKAINRLVKSKTSIKNEKMYILIKNLFCL
jgi:hypothetical protein